LAKITALKTETGKRVAVFIEGSLAFRLSAEIAKKRSLAVGANLEPKQVDEMLKADEAYRAMQAALRYLGYRPRSEKEVRDRLRRGRFPAALVADVMKRLKDLNLVNDATFAQFWKEGRDSSRPRGRRLLKQELHLKGVDRETAAAAVADVDEDEGAYRAAAKKVHSLKGLDDKTFRLKLGVFLQRRGYSYDLSRRTVERFAGREDTPD